MALSRAAGLCRLALRTQWEVARLLGSSAGAGEPPVSDKATPRPEDLAARPRETAPRPRAARQGLAPPRRVFSTPTATPEQMQLSLAIRDAASVNDVLDLVTQNQDHVTGVSISTALWVIARMKDSPGPARWLNREYGYRNLMRCAKSLMERGEVDAQGLSNMLYACGRLGKSPSPEWLAVFWGTSAPQLGKFLPQGLSNTMYACGQLKIKPPKEWLRAYWDASAAKLGDYKPQELSNTLLGCGRALISPPPDWLERYWSSSVPRLGECGPQALSNTLHSLGQLGIAPRADWLDRYWRATSASFDHFVLHALSSMLYACGKLGILPPDDWLEGYWRTTRARLDLYPPLVLNITLQACVLLGITPPDDWLHRYWDVVRFDDYDPALLLNMLRQIAQLHVMPSEDWVEDFCARCERGMRNMKQYHLAGIAHGLATLGLWDVPLWFSLWRCLCRFLAVDTPRWYMEDHMDARLMHQVLLAAAVERPGKLSASPKLLAAARKTWVDSKGNLSGSRLQADVSACLKRMGVPHANERWCDRAERLIDIAVEAEGRRPIALQVDEPALFMRDGRQKGSALLRNRMLRAHGWRVAVLNRGVWDRLTEAQREEYLRRALA